MPIIFSIRRILIYKALFLMVPGPAFAYVGPGAGLTMLDSLWGLLAVIMFVLVGLLVFPVKALCSWFREKRRTAREMQKADKQQSFNCDNHIKPDA